jgi:hypothetical protein
MENDYLTNVRGTQAYQSPTGGSGYVSPNDDQYANKTLANIKRQQWNDYMGKYPALQEQYLDMSMSPDFTLEQVDRVQGNVDQAFDRSNEFKGATLGRMGLNDTSPKNDLASTLSVAHGENSVRQHGKDRQMNAMVGGQMPSLQTQTGT